MNPCPKCSKVPASSELGTYQNAQTQGFTFTHKPCGGVFEITAKQVEESMGTKTFRDMWNEYVAPIVAPAAESFSMNWYPSGLLAEPVDEKVRVFPIRAAGKSEMTEVLGLFAHWQHLKRETERVEELLKQRVAEVRNGKGD